MSRVPAGSGPFGPGGVLPRPFDPDGASFAALLAVGGHTATLPSAGRMPVGLSPDGTTVLGGGSDGADGT